MNNTANIDQIVPQKVIRVLASRGHGIDGARVCATVEVNGTVITNEYKWSTFREAKDAKIRMGPEWDKWEDLYQRKCLDKCSMRFIVT